MRALLVLALVLPGAALAHDWYDPTCCSNADCHPIEFDDEPVPGSRGGWWWDGRYFDQSKIKPSKDKRFHGCVSGEGKPLCLYIREGY